MIAKDINFLSLPTLLLRHRWLWHLGFWLLYALSRAMPYYLTIAFYPVKLFWFMLLFMDLTFVPFTYGTVWLYRRLCNTGRYKTYVVLGLLIWAGYTLLQAHGMLFLIGDMQHMTGSTWNSIALNNSTKYFFGFILLTMAVYFKDNFIRQYNENQQRQLQLTTELENLKAQISPHFLFNTMNNFYGLAVSRSEKLPELMVRLSELLRYSLYETQHSTMPLAQEVKYLNDYIALEKIRLEDDLELTFEAEIDAGSEPRIAPLLLVVFVENAFKHAKKVQNTAISIFIRLQYRADGYFRFEVRNSCLPDQRSAESNSGIGLANVRKRLQALYPNAAHHLQITEENAVFSVVMEIFALNTRIYAAVDAPNSDVPTFAWNTAALLPTTNP